MGLFGKDEDDLRTSGVPTSARITYVDDTGKRRAGGAEMRAKIRIQIESGASRGREIDKPKWVPTDKLPRVGDRVTVRCDPDDLGDWAWGEAEMYAPAAPAGPAAPPPGVPAVPGVPGFPAMAGQGGLASLFGAQTADLQNLPSMIAAAFAAGNVSIEHQSHLIDATGDPALRAQILDTLRAHGVDVEAMGAGQAFGIPAAAATPPASPAAPVDLAERLKRLDTLRDKGLITEAEHADQRRRIIDSI
jgi:hypothetical protein